MNNNEQQVYIIAEAGVNHNGSIDLAKQLVDAAVYSGANAVKFQTFKANNLVSKNTPKAEYQKKTSNSEESQLDMLKRLELSEEEHHILSNYCQSKGIDFISSPFDMESIRFLTDQINIPLIKIPSGEITNAPYLLEIARTQKPVVLSTGMCSLLDIEKALGVLAFGYCNYDNDPTLEKFQEAYASEEGQRILKEKVAILHCTTEYPTPYEYVNLNAIQTIRHAFGLPVGYSDHTNGIAISIAAVAMGATVIEKHFTLDRDLPGPDHRASLEPNELQEMVAAIRQVELAKGSSIKYPTPIELKNKTIVRKSIVAARKIQKGEHFNEGNLTIKRPGSGLSPENWWNVIGTIADRDYDEDDVIQYG